MPLWLSGLWVLAWARPVSLPWLAVFLVLQLLRAWVLLTLGRRWTTRIIVLPGAPLVANGPYRYVSHPNYLVVVGGDRRSAALLRSAVVCLGLLRGQRGRPDDPDPRGDRGPRRSAPWSRSLTTTPGSR